MLGILMLELFDIGTVTTTYYLHREQGWAQVVKLSSHDDIANFLRSQPGLFRIDKDADVISYNFGDWYGLDEFRGYAGVTTNIATIAAERGTRALSGVAYYLGHAPQGLGLRTDFPQRAPASTSTAYRTHFREPGSFIVPKY